jgi:hypothetical protein
MRAGDFYGQAGERAQALWQMEKAANFFSKQASLYEKVGAEALEDLEKDSIQQLAVQARAKALEIGLNLGQEIEERKSIDGDALLIGEFPDIEEERKSFDGGPELEDFRDLNVSSYNNPAFDIFNIDDQDSSLLLPEEDGIDSAQHNQSYSQSHNQSHKLSQPIQGQKNGNPGSIDSNNIQSMLLNRGQRSIKDSKIRKLIKDGQYKNALTSRKPKDA